MKRGLSELFEYDDIEWSNKRMKLDDKKNSSSCSSTKVECIGDTIYFCAPVNKTSVLELSKIIKKKNDDLERIKRRDELIDEIVPKPLFLRITSYGGGLISARSAIDAIMSSKIPIHTIVDGCAASAATLMSIVGKKRYITKSSLMLVHQLSSIHAGKMHELEDDMKNSMLFMQHIRNLYKKYTKIPKKKLNKILKHDLWWDADLCLDYGLVDEIIE